MGLTQAVNSKANIKKPSSQDMPLSATYPVASVYRAISTSSQTTINLSGFTLDSGSPEQALVIVDGKVLTYGSSNDYIFAGVASDGSASAITLNQAIASGLNIQVVKLSLKKESEFQTDNRFTQLYEAEGQAFQGFVNSANTLTATTTTGTPITGTFHSLIPNRAAMVDPTQDLKARIGIDRSLTQQIFLIPNEAGPNGEQVYGAAGDQVNAIRFVGGWTNVVGTSGALIQASILGTDYVEITFYGTGLNLMLLIDNSARSMNYSVDGGTATSAGYPASGSAILSARDYPTNTVFSIVQGLTLGVHTVRIISTSTTTSATMSMYGFEVVNAASSVTTNPGISYLASKKLTLGTQSTIAYGNAVTGTRGGRVLHYQKSDGSVAQAFQATDSSSLYMTSASHTNEEVVKMFNWREFGSDRSDDFASFGSAVLTNLGYTLDDGVTSLSTNDGYVYAASPGILALGPGSSAGILTLTFVGTGIDIDWCGSNSTAGTSYQTTFYIDGTIVNGTGSINYTLNKNPTRIKIASGLPYGTHTLKIAKMNLTGGTIDIGISDFIVYQPKKPSLPTGALELADYNVLANYVANTVQGSDILATGVIRKNATREFTYVGTWVASLVPGSSGTTGESGGWQIASTTTTGYIQYTFFGTGFEWRFQIPGTTGGNYTVSVDGSSNLLGYTTSSYGTGVAFTAATGVVTTGTANTYGSGVSVSNIPLGLHTVKILFNSGSSINNGNLDIITPIHSYRLNTPYGLETALLIGSQSISDNRNTSILKDVSGATKNISQAVGLVQNPTTSSTSMVPMPDMSCPFKAKGNRIKVSYSATVAANAVVSAYVQVYVDGVAVNSIRSVAVPSASYNETVADSFVVPVSPGFHVVALYWMISSSTLTAINGQRNILVEDV